MGSTAQRATSVVGTPADCTDVAAHKSPRGGDMLIGPIEHLKLRQAPCDPNAVVHLFALGPPGVKSLPSGVRIRLLPQAEPTPVRLVGSFSSDVGVGPSELAHVIPASRW